MNSQTRVKLQIFLHRIEKKPAAFLFILLIGFLLTGTIRPQTMNDLEKLVATEKAFARTARQKSVRQAFLEFLAEDGLVFQPRAVKARKFWSARPETKALLAWNPVWADISSTGKIGYTTGDWSFHPQGAESKPVAFGQYITIWKEQTDGNFRAVLDIGISHNKPDRVATEWKSPKTYPMKKGKIKPFTSFGLQTQNPEKYFAADIRLYRDDKLPMIGKSTTLSEIRKEKTVTKNRKILTSTCAGAADFAYCYGEIQRSNGDGKSETGNALQIWKYRTGKWQIVLDVFTLIPPE